MERGRLLSKLGIGLLAESVWLLSRYLSPEVFESLAGSSNGRAALEHGFNGMGIILLANGIGIPKKIIVTIYSLGRIYVELGQAMAYSNPLQVEQLLFDGGGILLGVAVCALIDGAFPKSNEGN